MIDTISSYLKAPVKAAPLAAFRILFGALMMFATVRFVWHNWVAEYYIEPIFHFKYYGFEFVKSLGHYTYILFGLTFLAAAGMMVGWYYRISAVVFFLSFTYCELIDKTTYLNHYYFVSLVAFLMIFLPANCAYAVDAKRRTHLAYDRIPRAYLFVLQFLLAIVYINAGLAKLNSDWLGEAMPLQIWLPARDYLPVIGPFFQQEWTHYAMSWAGMLYDLTIPFFLFWRRTRVGAFAVVVLFHVMTRILFPIGIFPFVMIFATMIYFDATVHERWLAKVYRLLNWPVQITQRTLTWVGSGSQRALATLFIVFFVFQIAFPFRHLAYPGELFWTEQGYRFSWRVMLVEKGGYVIYKVTDPESGTWFYVDNADFLTDFQQKQLSTQPDFMLEFAHYLDAHYREQGMRDPVITVDSHVALNGRLSKRFVDPEVDLSAMKRGWQHKDWILPLEEEIYGF